jgi:hypothetical protein
MGEETVPTSREIVNMTTAPFDRNEQLIVSRPSVPPEERFWRRYSPNHEFSLSTASSISVWSLAGLLVLVLGHFSLTKRGGTAPVPIALAELEGAADGLNGADMENPGEAPNRPKAEAIAKQTPPPISGVSEATRLKEVVPSPPELPPFDREGRPIDLQSASREAMAQLGELSQHARAKLVSGGKPRGQGGPVIGKSGKPDGKLNPTETRNLRWVMQFNTTDGRDYLNQLRSLGAILAYADAAGGYCVLRDLKRTPARGEIEDLDAIERIFWRDSKKESVAGLTKALGLEARPSEFIAFFPDSLEKELLEKELRFRNRREEQIRETRFRIELRGNRYVPVVESQTPQ